MPRAPMGEVIFYGPNQVPGVRSIKSINCYLVNARKCKKHDLR